MAMSASGRLPPLNKTLGTKAAAMDNEAGGKRFQWLCEQSWFDEALTHHGHIEVDYSEHDYTVKALDRHIGKIGRA